MWTSRPEGRKRKPFAGSKGGGGPESLDLGGCSRLGGCDPAPRAGSSGVRGRSSPHPRRPEESGAFRDWGRTFRSPPAPGQPRRCLSLGSVSSSAAPVSSRFHGVWLRPSGSDGCQGAAVDSGRCGPKSSPASPRPPLATAHPPGGMQPRSNHAGPENARGWGKRHRASIQQPFIHDSLLPKKARAT